MQLKIKNCNNIENGEFDITEGRLNIKYAINGTGKSTISKAIEAFVTNDQEKKNLLLPFKYYGVEEENSPELIGYDQFKKVSVFNEKYIEDYVYQQNELIKNSFEIFVKSPDYDTHIKEIEKLLESINITFQNHPELEELIKVFQQFIDGFGKAKSGYSAAGAIGKGIGKGNKIDNIPVGLEVYEPYLKNNDNVKWIKWQLEGKHYLDMAEQCPYCSGPIKETKETILFMYSVLKENPDLVVLDDPISSFDGNKKFAIINMLFMGKHSLKNRTVLLLTHEFNTVIDAIYNMPYNFNPTPTAAFLTTKQGILQEKEITKADIKSFGEIAHANISSDMDSLNKLVYLRRLLEIENASGLAWQLLSNIFHKREKPEYHFSNGTPNRLMTPEEIQDATNEIKTNYISDFDYDTEYQKTQDITVLKELYQNSGSNYEKLQIYRIMFNENSSNSVIKKFVNEAFHIENDYLFQLNPCEYDTVPQYIIDECDKDILEICPQG